MFFHILVFRLYFSRTSLFKLSVKQKYIIENVNRANLLFYLIPLITKCYHLTGSKLEHATFFVKCSCRKMLLNTLACQNFRRFVLAFTLHLVGSFFNFGHN
jgi:hypothetical protein